MRIELMLFALHRLDYKEKKTVSTTTYLISVKVLISHHECEIVFISLSKGFLQNLKSSLDVYQYLDTEVFHVVSQSHFNL